MTFISNRAGWREPPSPPRHSAGGLVIRRFWASDVVLGPYPAGGWVIPGPRPSDGLVAVNVSPSVVREGPVSLLLTWDGSRAEPRLVAARTDDGLEPDLGTEVTPRLVSIENVYLEG